MSGTRVKVITNHWNGSRDALRIHVRPITSMDINHWLGPAYAKSVEIALESAAEEWPRKGMLEL